MPDTPAARIKFALRFIIMLLSLLCCTYMILALVFMTFEFSFEIPELFEQAGWYFIALLILIFPGVLVMQYKCQTRTELKMAAWSKRFWIMSLLALSLLCILPLTQRSTRSPVAMVKGDQRTLTIALETYYLDYNDYPAWSLDGTQNAFSMIGSKAAALRDQPTFLMRGTSNLETLTTPMAYVSSIFTDLFAAAKGTAFCYWRSSYGDGFILWSPGPDRKYDLSIKNISKAYDPLTTCPSNYLRELTYDPSNGTGSRGDVWRVKQ